MLLKSGMGNLYGIITLFMNRILHALDVNGTNSRDERTIEKYAPLIVLVGIVMFCYLPFLNKAYSIDDPLFLWSAQQIEKNPLDPYGFTVNWYRQEMPISFVTKNPPLTSYYIAAASFILGWDERAIHFIFLFPAIAVAVGAYLFAQRYCRHPLLAAFAGILTPVFLVSSLTVMSDMLMLAFWIFAVHLWIQGTENKSSGAFILAGLLISCAALTKYFGIMLIPLLFLYSLYRDRRLGFQNLYFLIPIFLLIVYHLWTERLYGRGLIFDAVQHAITKKSQSGSFIDARIFINSAFIGGCLASVLFFATKLWPRRVFLAGLFVLLAGTSLVFNVKQLGIFPLPPNTTDRIIFSFQFCIWTITGISIVVLALQDFYRDRGAESLLLFLWVTGTFLFAGFINWTTNGRSILPMIIPTGILITRRLEYRSKTGSLQKIRSCAIPLALSAILSISVTWADYAFANTARSAATFICNKYGNTNQTIWFQGHWGFQYYLERYGALPIDATQRRCKPGDIIVNPSTNTNIRMVPKQWVTRIDSMKFLSSKYAAATDFDLGAGFYSDVFGPLPFAFGFVIPETFVIYYFHGYTSLKP